MTPMSPQELRAALTAPFVPGEALDLRARRITGALDLSGQSLCGFDLTGSVFEGRVTLAGATCLGLTWFRDCVFEQGLDGGGAVFGHDLRCDGAEFRGDACLRGAEMRGTCVLDAAVLRQETDLAGAEILSSFSCAATRFHGPVDLAGATLLGGLWAEGAIFQSGVNASDAEVYGRTWLRRITGADDRGGSCHASLMEQITPYGYMWT
ncbi:pentapeptide repeat-containing protein [Leisingera methylohalidivorans]|uniref:Pentapeptide repeat-containing protein n=1 Tax=Leisingera methylohalidivorans DSM 14336 TaxID=999552 RepID=V9VWN3_9RHOB|nr:pentapeptide repeat-containing protein [Leisingera methylohalidivorans]AHD03176.1 hypothetical protein METH_15640 [Leisingera methylohalidivorans DSM 14336]